MMELFKPEIGLMFWMLIVFLVILAILAKYAWPVIIKSLEERAAFIDSGVKYTEEAMQQMENTKGEVRNLLAEAHKQQLSILQETERMKQGMIEEAKKTATIGAQKILDAAQVSIDQAKREAELQMRKQVGTLSIDIAEKLLREKLADDGAQIDLITKCLDEIGKKKND